MGVVIDVFELEYNGCTWLQVLCPDGLGWTNSKWTKRINNDEVKDES